MKNKTFSENSYAASEVIGAIILVLIAVGAFAAIYYQVFPVPLPSPESHIKLVGYIDEERNVVIQHVGGEALISYKIQSVRENGSTNMNSYDNLPRMIGDDLPINIRLEENETQIHVIVWSTQRDGSEQIVFDGIITPEQHPPGPGGSPLLDPMLVSTLRDDTPDEDLICYNYTIHPNIPPITFIYNWMVASTGPYSSLTRILMPFDSQNLFQTKDYSGNHYNGTVNGANWTNAGILGGAYQFGGDDFITIPYCFENNPIDKITVEAWIKTSLTSGTIMSYDRNKYWELAVTNGHVKWSTNSSDGAVDLIGTILVNDNKWHLVAATYDASLGDCAIYVDGRLDSEKHVHAAGNLLGSSDAPVGAIGKGTGLASRQSVFSTSFETTGEKNNWKQDNETGAGGGSPNWENVYYDTFESSYGNWNDGGSDCIRYTGGTYAHQGSCAIDLQENGWPQSAMYSDVITAHLRDYKQMSISFWWKAIDLENGEDLWVNYYDGSHFHRLATLVIGTGMYSNNVFYHTVCYVNETEYLFTDQSFFTIQCDASSTNDDFYVDEIYINATGESRIECTFDLLSSAVVTPKTGSYSIGGTGDFDPEYALFNRSGIDISGYTDVIVSLWYSYKDTETEDFFGFYYKNGSIWAPVFVVADLQIGSGQKPWAYAEIHIPKTIQTLVFQFKWMSSSTTEYVAIDDVVITGVPIGGENNFTGSIDEIKIYPRVLSPEQLYQNYLCTKDGNTTCSVIVSEEIQIGEEWICQVTPNNGIDDDITWSNPVILGGGG